MKIVICGSMVFSEKMLEIGELLVEKGYEVTLPRHTEEYTELDSIEGIHKESAKNKIEDDLIRDYYFTIKKSDAVLVVNERKNGVDNYIGGNAFLEMGFAHVLGKKLFVLNNMPEVSYKDEIIAMQPVFLNGDVNKLDEVLN